MKVLKNRHFSRKIFLILITAVLLSFSVSFYADGPYDFDKTFRNEFEGIVMHHTGTRSDNPTIKFLSDIQKTTVYKPVFDASFPGKKMYSNHLYDGKETFFCYHWLVYPDGSKIQALKDIFKSNGKWYIDNVGWHAGTWETNGKTIAIAVAGNYMNRYPSDAALKSMAEIIAGYRKKTGKNLYVIGHREVKATECPGNKFLGKKGWKKTLIKMADEMVSPAE